MSDHERHSGGGALLAFGALGIVFGDIGTSPLYAFRETFHHADLEVTKATAFGAASVAFWALVIVICLKYLATVMRADNHGEGGILALTSLVIPPEGQVVSRVAAGVVTLGVFGTALLYGDGLITPAISVLSAVEGFEVATPAFERWVIPIAVVILVALFVIQRRGTAGIAKVFSPVMVVWFVVIGVLGINQIRQAPEVMRAISPTYAVDLFVQHPWKAFIALGSIFLVVTGGEALYADMGHFGRGPITLAWYVLVLPGLILNYFGQAALLSGRPMDHIEELSPFYAMSPDWAITPLAILATMATVIASQALISGAFSLTVQAVQLDYLPRLAILHTSERHIGQVYVPLVNWLLMIGCVGLVVVFQTSTALAAAYGIAVTTTMLITTLIFYRFAARPVELVGDQSARGPDSVPDRRHRIPLRQRAEDPARWLVPAARRFRTRDPDDHLAQGARSRRRTHPARGAADARGRRRGPRRWCGSRRRVSRSTCSRTKEPPRPRSCRTFVTTACCTTTVLLVSVHTADAPRVDDDARANVTDLGNGIELVRLNYGFMEDPDIPVALAALDLDGRRRVRTRPTSSAVNR